MLINTALGKKNQAIGRSKGGLSTKIHARTDALGNPTGFYFIDGQVHDLNGSDVLLDLSLSQTWLMDKAYNSRDRVIDPILEAKGQVVMPAKSNSIDQRDYDRNLYKARHLIENFFAKLKQYRAIATRYDKLAQNFLSAIYLASTIIWLNWWHALIHNHAPQVIREHVHIQLSHAQFEQFVEVCQTQNKVPTRLKQAAQLIDKENF